MGPRLWEDKVQCGEMMENEMPALKLQLYGVAMTDDDVYDTCMMIRMIGQGSSEEAAQPLDTL